MRTLQLTPALAIGMAAMIEATPAIDMLDWHQDMWGQSGRP
ncbi:MAG: hypothetical protein V3R87_02805 [Dehalococcoidia bacterium]